MKRPSLLAPLFVLVGCAVQPSTASAQIRMIPSVPTGGAPGSPTASPMASPTAPITRVNWLHAAPVQDKLLVGSDGSTYIGVWIDTPAQAPAAVIRAPLDVALVIDTSGSMAGEKITNARSAATSFIESLADGDLVSLIAFSDSVRSLSSPTLVGPGTRSGLIAAVGGLQAMGGTNLYGGLSAGEAAVALAPATHPVRRVVVISDGRANIGPSSPDELAAVASRGTESGAQVTAIGVGLDYDESTLGTLAVHSSGRMYHLESPEQMSAILHDELSLLGQTVASNAVLEFVPAPGVTVEAGDSVRSDRSGTTLRVPLGALYGSQHREVLLRARVSTGAVGARSLGTARLTWQDPVGTHDPHATEIPLRCELTADPAAPARSVDSRVQAMVASHVAAQEQQHAAQLLNQGDAVNAAAELDRADRRLRQASQMHFADEGVRSQLMRQSEGVSRGRAATAAAAAAPAAARPQVTRGAALQNNADAMHAYGF